MNATRRPFVLVVLLAKANPSLLRRKSQRSPLRTGAWIRFVVLWWRPTPGLWSSSRDLLPIKVENSPSFSDYSVIYSEYLASFSEYSASFSDYSASYSHCSANYSNFSASLSDYLSNYPDYSASYSKYKARFPDYSASYSDYSVNYSVCSLDTAEIGTLTSGWQLLALQINTICWLPISR